MTTKSLPVCLLTLAAAVPLVLTLAARANPQDNWPQWRGPLASGVAPLADPPLEWSETKNVKWKVNLPGRGTATPIVWENRIFILTAIGPENKPSAAPAAASLTANNINAGTNAATEAGRPRGGGHTRHRSPSAAGALALPRSRPGSFSSWFCVWIERPVKPSGKRRRRKKFPMKAIIRITDSPRHRPLPTASLFTPTSARAGCIATTWTAI